jgi:molybdate transport system regulatory protein
VRSKPYPGLALRVLAAETPALGPGKAQLVELIAATGSISAAARAMGMSYRRAWLLVEALNSSFVQPLVLTAVGGKAGGGAIVTEFGQQVTAEYRAMQVKASAAVAADLKAFSRHLRKPRSKAA